MAKNSQGQKKKCEKARHQLTQVIAHGPNKSNHGRTAYDRHLMRHALATRVRWPQKKRTDGPSLRMSPMKRQRDGRRASKKGAPKEWPRTPQFPRAPQDTPASDDGRVDLPKAA